MIQVDTYRFFNMFRHVPHRVHLKTATPVLVWFVWPSGGSSHDLRLAHVGCSDLLFLRSVPFSHETLLKLRYWVPGPEWAGPLQPAFEAHFDIQKKYRKRAKDETGDVLLQIVVYKSWFHISFRKTMLISFIMVSPMPLCCNQFAAFNGFDGTSRIQKKPWVLDLLCQFNHRDFSEFPFNQ